MEILTYLKIVENIKLGQVVSFDKASIKPEMIELFIKNGFTITETPNGIQVKADQ